MSRKTIINTLIYLCLISGCYIGAFFIRLRGNIDDWTLLQIWNATPAVLLSKLLALACLGQIKNERRYRGADRAKDFISIFNAACLGSLLFIFATYLIFGIRDLPQSVFFIDWLLFLFFFASIRYSIWSTANKWIRELVRGVIRAPFKKANGKNLSSDMTVLNHVTRMKRIREILRIHGDVFTPDVWITLTVTASLILGCYFCLPHLYRWWASARCRERLSKLEIRISSLSQVSEPALRNALPSVQAQLDYQKYLFEDKLNSDSTWGLRYVLSGLDSVEDKVNEIEKGIDPFGIRYGFLLRGYESEIDNTVQPYSLYVPSSFFSGRKLPLIVKLHGHGWFRPFQGYPAPEIRGAIVLSPHGRGSNDYMYIGEVDVLKTIEEVKKYYNVDSDRIYLMGRSMGGTGTWNLATHFPDRFAAIAPQAGNADYKAWIEAWSKEEIKENPEPRRSNSPALTYAQLKRFLKDRDNPVAYAENLLNVPVYCTHGSDDETVPVEHARNMVERLRMLSYNVTYLEYLGYGHGGFPKSDYDYRLYWLAGQQRIERPKHVRYKTGRLRHSGAYWVKINQFEEPLKFAEIDARISAGKLSSVNVNVETRNISSFTLNMKKMPLTNLDHWVKIKRKRTMKVTIDGADTYEKELPQSNKEKLHTQRITFLKARADEDDQSRWTIREESSPYTSEASLNTTSSNDAHPSPRPLSKMPWLEGPIEDAMLTGFLVVYGTIADTELERWIVKEEAMRFVREWKRRYGKPCRVKSDTEVTPKDIEHFNLILYGSPDANKVVASINDNLPIRMKGREIIVGKKIFSEDDFGVTDMGLKMCYPNPLNPAKYAVVFAGVTWKGMYQINSRFGNWFDWIVYDNRNWFDYGIFDNKTKSPETFLCVGFFDQNWKLSSNYQWLGLEQSRKISLPRKVPETRFPPPNVKVLFLSDLIPTKISQQKGPIGFDSTSEGNIIRLGEKEYPHGIGVRVPSKVTFKIDGYFKYFRAIVGIDLEGKNRASKAREDAEEVQFQVFGDEELLYESKKMKWNSEPEEIDISIRGVKELMLRARARGSKLWLFGSADWAEARVVK